jgi:hypothetical protein
MPATNRILEAHFCTTGTPPSLSKTTIGQAALVPDELIEKSFSDFGLSERQARRGREADERRVLLV